MPVALIYSWTNWFNNKANLTTFFLLFLNDRTLTFWQRTAVSQQQLEPISLCEWPFSILLRYSYCSLISLKLKDVRKTEQTHTHLCSVLASVWLPSYVRYTGVWEVLMPTHRGVLAATFTGLVLHVLLSYKELRVNLKVEFTSHERQKNASRYVF